MLDYNASGQVIGVEILDFMQRMQQGEVASENIATSVQPVALEA